MNKPKSYFLDFLEAAEMYSLTVKPSFLVPKFSSSSSSCPPHSWVGSSSSLISFPIKMKNRGSRISFRLDAYDSSKNDGPNASGGDSKPPNGTLVLLFRLSLLAQLAYLLCLSVYCIWLS